jgi:hypothetical protein
MRAMIESRKERSMPQPWRGLPFIALALAFLAIGVSTNSAFYALAVVFFVIGVALMRRQ